MIKNLSYSQLKKFFSLRPRESHKGDYGHALIIAGSSSYPGAAVLCANGCTRSGGGLVTLAYPESAGAAILPRLYPEVMALGLPDKNGAISPSGAEKALKFIAARKVSSVAAGCGLTVSADVKKFLKEFLAANPVPAVIDADGLNNFAGDTGVFGRLKSRAVLTPHPGEMSRLAGLSVPFIKNKMEECAAGFAEKYGVVCVLKGSRTVVAAGKGRVFASAAGNAGMAKGGSGDVLTGIIAAFIGRTEDFAGAVCAAVYLHGLAGNLAMDEKTDISMLPHDIIKNISGAVKKIRGR